MSFVNPCFHGVTGCMYLWFDLFQAKGYLETAMKMDSTHMQAVYHMADILAQQQHYDKGIEL